MPPVPSCEYPPLNSLFCLLLLYKLFRYFFFSSIGHVYKCSRHCCSSEKQSTFWLLLRGLTGGQEVIYHLHTAWFKPIISVLPHHNHMHCTAMVVRRYVSFSLPDWSPWLLYCTMLQDACRVGVFCDVLIACFIQFLTTCTYAALPPSSWVGSINFVIYDGWPWHQFN